MPKLFQLATTWLAIAALLFNSSLSYARPSLGAVGGGGARPGGGGGMARPSMPQMSRPSMPQMSRPSPNISRPSMPSGNFSRPSPNISRPSTPNLSRPSMPSVSNKPKLPSNPSLGSRPSLGGFQPGVSTKPNFPTNKPTLPGGGNIGTTRPGTGNIGATRPSLKPPGDLKPITRPGTTPTLPGGSGNLPSIAKPFPGGTNPLPGITKPGTKPSLPGGPGDIATRPTLPGGTKPTLPGTKPNLPGGISTLPSNRPGFGNIDRPTTLPGKPGTGIGTLPGKPNPGDLTRPTPLPQPIIPGRPGGGGDRPGKPDRPQIGGGGNWNGGNWNGNRPGGGNNRPWIGGGNNNNIGNNIINNNNNFINNNNNININNWNRPGWGVGGGGWNNGWNNNWNDHWHNNYINNHYHGWYHGCWNGHWHNNWWGPWTVGISAWGLYSLAGWGYGTTYYNPYYIAAATPVYNYSQPVVVQNYYTTDDNGDQIAAAPQPTAEQLQPFDDGLAKFKAGDYLSALQKFDQALREFPKDAVVHEVRALTLFALGRYQEAGAALNALLATSPGMDWTTMSGLYGDPAAYTGQLRKLEDYCRAHKDDAAAMFALVYHYLVIGQQDSAITVLKHIVKIQPKDVVAARMLKSLEPDQPAADPAVVAKPAVQDPAPPAQDPAAPAANAPQTDLVGKWQATAGKTTITLTITEESAYTWEAATADQKPVKLEGQITTSPEAMILSNAAQGDMMGKVKSLGPDKFEFSIAGTPPGEPGLSFSRVK